MRGKKLKQINNISITQVGATFFAWTPLNELLYQTKDYKIICDFCNECTLYKKSRTKIKQNKTVEPIVRTFKNNIEISDHLKARKLIEKGTILIYHGTKNKDIIPNFDFMNIDNDYGKGFYTTPDKELGKEWAYASYTQGSDGYLLTYQIDLTKLKVLDLTALNSLHWVAELLAHRELNLEGKEAYQDTINDFVSKYKLNTDDYDVIIGYRADDSYFTYAMDFVIGAIYRETLENALKYGDLGLQVFIKSKKAFSSLQPIGTAELVDTKYKAYYKKRDIAARDKYNKEKRMTSIIKEKKRISDFL